MEQIREDDNWLTPNENKERVQTNAQGEVIGQHKKSNYYVF